MKEEGEGVVVGFWCGYISGGYVLQIKSNIVLMVPANVTFICCLCVLRLKCVYVPMHLPVYHFVSMWSTAIVYQLYCMYVLYKLYVGRTWTLVYLLLWTVCVL